MAPATISAFYLHLTLAEHLPTLPAQRQPVFPAVIISLKSSRGLIMDINIMNLVTTLKDNVHQQLYFDILTASTLLSKWFSTLAMHYSYLESS